MNPAFGKPFVLVVLVTLILISTSTPTGAQPPEPPVILENGEFLLDLDKLPQATTERTETTVVGGNNEVNVVSSWWSSSGTTFVPASSSILYDYGGSGCVDTGASFDVWRGQVNLPQGSTITGMYFNYENDVIDPIDSFIWLRRYSYNGAYDDILAIQGTSTPIGMQTTFSSVAANNVVDNFDYNYVLVWSGISDQNLCGVNIRFTPPPIFLNALPLINR